MEEHSSDNSFEYKKNDADTSDVSRQLNIIIKKYGLAFGGILLVGVLATLFIINSNNSDPGISPEPLLEVETTPLLSTEEVEMARVSLKGSSSTDNSISNNIKAQNTGSIDIYSVDASKLGSTKSITDEEAALIVENNTPLPPPEAVKIESNGSGIIIGDVTVNKTATKGKSAVPRTIEGLVFSIANENKFITLTSPDGAYQISVNDDTKFVINNSEFSFSDLKQSDIVKITGFGTESANEFTASSVEIIDTFEFNSRIN